MYGRDPKELLLGHLNFPDEETEAQRGNVKLTESHTAGKPGVPCGSWGLTTGDARGKEAQRTRRSKFKPPFF